MNEQIEKIYEQSHVTITRKVLKGGWDNDREPYQYKTETITEFSRFKFAELIVIECAKIMEDWYQNESQWPPATYILRQFGIEEENMNTKILCPKCGADREKEPCRKGHAAPFNGVCPMGCD